MKMQNTARDLSVGSNGKNTATKIWRPWFASACFTFITALAWPGTSVGKQPVSLAGEWRFEIAGADAQAFASKLPGRIVLPGTIDDTGMWSYHQINAFNTDGDNYLKKINTQYGPSANIEQFCAKAAACRPGRQRDMQVNAESEYAVE